ncbi:MAG: lamin tail domain-containing protein [Myxococcota bacterium]|nr:lamin tail domain-containing protein [Myxococcota bacterium]
MMYRILPLLILGLPTFGCDDPCPTGLSCVRSCPPGTHGVCSVDSLCLCASSSLEQSGADPWTGHLDETEFDHDGCATAEPGDIIISEVLIDGEPDETSEFVEIVNRRDESIDLAGVSIWSNRGDRMLRRIGFMTGCIPPMGAMAVYEQQLQWRVVPPSPRALSAQIGRFGFSNTASFNFEIRAADGALLDQVSGLGEMIRPGISLSRLIDSAEHEPQLINHDVLQPGQSSSPGFCPNGGRYDMSCLDVDGDDYGCPEPKSGELVINEVLIDGRETEDEEFVELVNTSRSPIALGGLEIWSNRGSSMVRRISFFSGCMPGRGAVALWHDAARQLWTPHPETPIEFQTARFGFPNSAHFRFELRTSLGDVLDAFYGHKKLIRPGTSLNRLPEVTGQNIVMHRAKTSSPSLCMNGQPHNQGCPEPIINRLIPSSSNLHRATGPRLLSRP